MIFGIGVDIVQIQRIEDAANRFGEKFSMKVLTSREQPCKTPEDLAVHFAAKEAFVKALGTGFRGVSFKDIEVLHNELKKPYYVVSDKISRMFGPFQSHLSISHEKDYVIAMAVIEKI